MAKNLARCFLVLILFPVHALAVPILTNPGFETGSLDPWFADSGTPVITNAEAHSGTFSVASLSGDEIRQNFSPVPTSLINQVSFWVRRDGGPFNSVRFYYDDSSEESSLVNGIGTGDGWMFFDVTADLAVGKNLSGFGVFGTSPGPAFLDDFTVDAIIGIPEPATALLLAVGLLGLGYRRTKS